MKRFSLLSIILLLFSAGILPAQKEIEVGTNLLVDNNIFRNHTGQGDMVTIPYADLGYQFNSDKDSEAIDALFLGYSGQFFLFREMSRRDFSVHRFGTDYNHLWPESRNLLALGAALATSGSVTLFHAPGHTAEADTVEQAFGGGEPKETHEVTRNDLDAVYDKLTTIAPGGNVDFVTLGCPHYTLDQLRYVADWFRENKQRVHPGVRLWICTNRMTKQAATWEGVTQMIESAAGLVICDSCPVESHMRISTCKEHGLKTPQCEAMVADSCKMARYVGDLIGCKTALRPRDECLKAAVGGRIG